MPIIKWEPFFPDFDDFFGEHARAMAKASGFMPAVNVYKKGSNIMVEASIPDVDPDKIDVHVENNVLSIKGSTEKKTEVDEKNYYRKEVSSGSFYRSVALPELVNGDKIEAEYHDGMLIITAPVAKKGFSKKISIKKIEKKKSEKKKK